MTAFCKLCFKMFFPSRQNAVQEQEQERRRKNEERRQKNDHKAFIKKSVRLILLVCKAVSEAGFGFSGKLVSESLFLK